MTEIGDRLRKVVAEHLGIDPSKVTDDAAFIEDLGADSLDAVELSMLFEEEFGCDIPDDLAAKAATVKQAIDFIKARLSKGR